MLYRTAAPEALGDAEDLDANPGSGAVAVAEMLDDGIGRAAGADGPVLIVGDSGSGPALLARFIHEESRRFAAPMATVCCTGLPDTLLESELFGHVRGSFPGAYRDKPGLLEMAASGTLFVDDVFQMSARLQTLLLRFMQTGEIQRVGDETTNGRVDVRIIASAGVLWESQMASGTFRKDLYERFNTVSLASRRHLEIGHGSARKQVMTRFAQPSRPSD